MKLARIYVFGDSQTYGAWDSQGGWCDRIKLEMHQLTLDESAGVKYQMFNLGIGGEHSRGLLGRFKTELDFRHRPDWPPVIVIATGSNDTRHSSGSDPIVPIDEYRTNIKALIEIARTYTSRILIVGLATVRDADTAFKSTIISQQHITEYNQVLAKVAEEESIQLVDVHSAMQSNTEGDLFAKDGIHLNDNGHQFVAGLVKPQLIKLLEE
ncbi:hypothetical protein IPG36_06395 [bacterium]|nr:MAG: hypothetical protein IPG36_06395 [bacterium]